MLCGVCVVAIMQPTGTTVLGVWCFLLPTAHSLGNHLHVLWQCGGLCGAVGLYRVEGNTSLQGNARYDFSTTKLSFNYN